MLTRKFSKPKYIQDKALALFLVSFFLLASSCGGAYREPSVAYSFDGPPLYIRGVLEDTALVGRMDRYMMVGIGKISVESTDPALPFQCEATLDSPPTEKGRIRGLMNCDNNEIIYFTLRNLGPDQGVGVGTVHKKAKEMVIFYHPSDEEAIRRLPEVREDIRQARKALNKEHTTTAEVKSPAPASEVSPKEREAYPLDDGQALSPGIGTELRSGTGTAIDTGISSGTVIDAGTVTGSGVGTKSTIKELPPETGEPLYQRIRNKPPTALGASGVYENGSGPAPVLSERMDAYKSKKSDRDNSDKEDRDTLKPYDERESREFRSVKTGLESDS